MAIRLAAACSAAPPVPADMAPSPAAARFPGPRSFTQASAARTPLEFGKQRRQVQRGDFREIDDQAGCAHQRLEATAPCPPPDGRAASRPASRPMRQRRDQRLAPGSGSAAAGRSPRRPAGSAPCRPSRTKSSGRTPHRPTTRIPEFARPPGLALHQQRPITAAPPRGRQKLAPRRPPACVLQVEHQPARRLVAGAAPCRQLHHHRDSRTASAAAAGILRRDGDRASAPTGCHRPPARPAIRPGSAPAGLSARAPTRTDARAAVAVRRHPTSPCSAAVRARPRGCGGPAPGARSRAPPGRAWRTPAARPSPACSDATPPVVSPRTQNSTGARMIGIGGLVRLSIAVASSGPAGACTTRILPTSGAALGFVTRPTRQMDASRFNLDGTRIADPPIPAQRRPARNAASAAIRPAPVAVETMASASRAHRPGARQSPRGGQQVLQPVMHSTPAAAAPPRARSSASPVGFRRPAAAGADRHHRPQPRCSAGGGQEQPPVLELADVQQDRAGAGIARQPVQHHAEPISGLLPTPTMWRKPTPFGAAQSITARQIAADCETSPSRPAAVEV